LFGDKVVVESNGTDTLKYTYDNAGNLVGMNLNGVYKMASSDKPRTYTLTSVDVTVKEYKVLEYSWHVTNQVV
jgi:YD repeat-containing protein